MSRDLMRYSCWTRKGGALFDLVIGISMGFVVLLTVGMFQNTQFKMFIKQRADFDLQDEINVISVALEKYTVDIVDINTPNNQLVWSNELVVVYPNPAGGTLQRRIYRDGNNRLMIQPNTEAATTFVIGDGVEDIRFRYVELYAGKRLIRVDVTIKKFAGPDYYVSETKSLKYRVGM